MTTLENPMKAIGLLIFSFISFYSLFAEVKGPALFAPFIGCYSYEMFNDTPYNTLWLAKIEKTDHSMYFQSIKGEEIKSFQISVFRPMEDSGDRMEWFEAFHDLGFYSVQGSTKCYEFKGDVLFVGQKDLLSTKVCLENLNEQKVAVSILRQSDYLSQSRFSYLLNRKPCPEILRK